jgi:hypothetical protein
MKLLYALPFLNEETTEAQRDANLVSDYDQCYAEVSILFRALAVGPSPLKPTLAVINTFLAYFESNWMESQKRRLCNLFNVDDNTHRTNNDIEGYHRKLNDDFKNKSNLWTFIGQLKRQQLFKELEVEKLLRDRNPSRAPSRWALQKERDLASAKILYTTEGFSSPMDYLKIVAKSMGVKGTKHS